MSRYGTERVAEYERAIARTKSYTTQAVLTFVLYLVFWLPGVIANVLFLMDAKDMEKRAGHSLPGVGCLTFMLIAQAVALLGGGACFVLVMVLGAAGS
jgi:hypothetical protein